MSARLIEGAIRLEGDCGVEQAEALAGLLADHPDAVVDISACASLHGAVLQTLISFAPQVRGTFADPFLNLWIWPALTSVAEP
jgi:hypothetical protein